MKATLAASVTLALLAGCASQPKLPPTAAEASQWKRTSTVTDVKQYLASIQALEHGDKLRREVFATTTIGHELEAVLVADPMPLSLDASAMGDRVRVLVNANIHGGEVEGKEAVQMLLAEFASGLHDELLDDLVVLFVPIYNADGNERIDRKNRATQNGPEEGVGERTNTQGLDLNRDFIKAESPECRGLLALFGEFDPHLFMDLHTTNGSYHGYHLTYSPSLSTNVDPAINGFMRSEFLPAVRSAMADEHGYRVYDYGNFTGKGDEKRWVTYDHRPRFGTNYYGLRNRLSLLSEAYSYRDFETRVRATRAFVLETLRACATRATAIRNVCRASDRRMFEQSLVFFGWKTQYGRPRADSILVGAVDEIELPDHLGVRRVAKPGYTRQSMMVQTAFESAESIELPAAWAILEPTDRVRDLLDAHGIESFVLEKTASVKAHHFRRDAFELAERPFQGHNELTLEGRWGKSDLQFVDAGTLVVPSRQRLGRLAAQLLEPLSEDSLFTWNFFAEEGDAPNDPAHVPVLRLEAVPK